MNFQNAAAYIPQRPPMVMVDNIIAADEKSMTCGFYIREDNLLVSKGQFTEAGLIENIAQTAAAHQGYYHHTDKDPQVGYIGALKDFKIHALPNVNEVLTTTIEITNVILGATVILGKTFCGEKLLAECEMKIFMKEQ